LAVIALATSVSSAQYYPPGWPDGAAWVELSSVGQIATGPDTGMFEYIYDVWGGDQTWLKYVDIDYDATLQVNQWTDTTYGLGTVDQHWCAMSQGLGIPYNGYTDPERWPSRWLDTNGDFIKDDWVLPDAGTHPWAYDNLWHDGNEYIIDQHVWRQPTLNDTGIHFTNTNGFLSSAWMVEGLSMTIRVVHPYAPGETGFSVYHYNGERVYGTVLGPVIPPSSVDGDLDGDGDADADDIDILCANMGGDPADYDMDGDGDVDEDDMTFHVENYLEYDSNGDGNPDGTGTFRGDFNTDGSVNGTDLSIMNGNFGSAVGFAGGNANCDSTVNGTDLSILAGVFGNVATAAIPEPLTMGLLSLGGIAMLRRRK
jgi:hypothetical protein